MEFDWVRTFLAVSERESFSAAAAALFCSQARVSSHIRALERDVEAQLFDRSRRPVALTEAGCAFLPHARQLLLEIESGRSDVAAAAGGQYGEVYVGSYPSASAAYMPQLLHRFARHYPNVYVRFVEVGSVQLESVLLGGQADLIVRPMSPRIRSSGVVSRILWRERLHAVLSPKHPLASAERPIAIHELRGEPIIVTGGRPAGAPARYFETHTALSREGGEPYLTHNTTQPQTLISLVRNGHGTGLTNTLALRVSDTTGVVVVDIAEPTENREVAVHWMKQGPRSAAARSLLATILEAPIPEDVEPA